MCPRHQRKESELVPREFTASQRCWKVSWCSSCATGDLKLGEHPLVSCWWCSALTSVFMLLQTAIHIPVPLKPDWLEVAERGGVEACLNVMLVCTSFWTSLLRWCFSVNHVILFFFIFLSSVLFFFPLMLSTGWEITQCLSMGYSTCESCSSFPMTHRWCPPVC